MTYYSRIFADVKRFFKKLQCHDWQCRCCHCEERSDVAISMHHSPEASPSISAQRLPRPLRGLAMTPVFACHCEEAAGRRGNPSFCWQSSSAMHCPSLPARVLAAALRGRSACTGYGLPRPLWGLAMTDVVDGLRLGFDFLCHCEERSDVAISRHRRTVNFR